MTIEARSTSVEVSTPLLLDSRAILPTWDFSYRSYGVAPNDSNVVVVLPGLSASPVMIEPTSATRRGWWERIVHPGGPIDTSKYHVVCVTYLGSPFGNAPCSSPIFDGTRDSDGIPRLTVTDIALGVSHGLRTAGYERPCATVGMSMGGMVQHALAIHDPTLASNVISISSALSPSGYALLARGIQRALAHTSLHDPLNTSLRAYIAARAIGCLLYRGHEEWDGLEQVSESDIDVRTDRFLTKVAAFCDTYEVEAFLSLSRAIDTYRGAPLSLEAWGDTRSRACVLGADSDTLYPPRQQRELAAAYKRASPDTTLEFLATKGGHDSFLNEQETFGQSIRTFFDTLGAT